MGAVDQLKFERELANRRKYTPEEARQNIAETLLGLAYSTPGIANSMSIRDAFEAREAAAKTDDQQEKKRLNAQAVASVLSAFLPFSIGSPASGASTRFGVFAPVAEGKNAARARSMFEELSPEIGRTPANKRIWQETGTFFGPEGRLLREIRDNPGMNIKGSFAAGDRAKLASVIDHPELFGEFPEYRDINVSFVKSPPSRAKYSGWDRETGDMIIDESFSGNDLRVQLAKNLQYRINEQFNRVNAARESASSKVQDASTAIANTRKAIADKLISREVGQSYIDSLDNTIKEGNRIRNEAVVTPGSYAEKRGFTVGEELSGKKRKRLLQDFWTDRSAGKQEAKTVKYRAYSPERNGYPYNQQNYFMRDAVSIPHADISGEELADFINIWRAYGQGAPQRR